MRGEIRGVVFDGDPTPNVYSLRLPRVRLAGGSGFRVAMFPMAQLFACIVIDVCSSGVGPSYFSWHRWLLLTGVADVFCVGYQSLNCCATRSAVILDADLSESVFVPSPQQALWEFHWVEAWTPVVACPAVQFEPCPISRGIHSYLVLDRLAAVSRGEPLWPIETNSMRMAHLWSLTDKPMLRWPLSVNIGVSENWGSTISIQFPENAVLAPFFCCFSLVVFVLLIVISIYVP